MAVNHRNVVSCLDDEEHHVSACPRTAGAVLASEKAGLAFWRLRRRSLRAAAIVHLRTRRGRPDVLYRAWRPNHAITCRVCPGFFVCGDCFNRQSYQHTPEHQVGRRRHDQAACRFRSQDCSGRAGALVLVCGRLWQYPQWSENNTLALRQSAIFRVFWWPLCVCVHVTRFA